MKNDVEFKNWALIAIIIGTIIIGISSAILAWKMIEPNGFGEWIIFAVLWTVIGYIGRFIFTFFIGLFGGIKK